MRLTALLSDPPSRTPYPLWHKSHAQRCPLGENREWWCPHHLREAPGLARQEKGAQYRRWIPSGPDNWVGPHLLSCGCDTAVLNAGDSPWCNNGGQGIRGGMLLILPLLPNAERELLGKLRARLATATDDNQWLVGCKILMDKMVMVERRGNNENGDNGEEERHNLLMI
jgi:hypothetical protein